MVSEFELMNLFEMVLRSLIPEQTLIYYIIRFVGLYALVACMSRSREGFPTTFLGTPSHTEQQQHQSSPR